MNVRQLLNVLVFTANVAVISATGLPEVFASRSITNPLKNRRIKFTPTVKNASGKRTLERRQES